MNFFKSVLNGEFGYSAEQRGLRGGLSVHLFVEVNGHPAIAGTATLSDAGVDSYGLPLLLRRTLHGHELPSNENSDQVVIGSTNIGPKFRHVLYPYSFITNDEVPVTLGEMFTSAYYAWDTRAMRLVARSDSTGPVSTPDAHAMAVVDAREEEDDVVEVATDEDFRGKKVSVLPFNPRNYEREEIWMDIFQMEEVRNPLRAVSEKHEEDLLQSLKTNKYQYSVGLMTVANPASGSFGTWDVEDMLEQQENGRFLKAGFFLAIVDGRHRRSCILKIAESKEPGTEWASQPIRVTLIKATGTQVLTDHELLKMSSSANVLSGLVLRDSSLTAVIKSLIQYSKTFDSTYDVSFDEARITDIAKDLVSCGFVQGAVESSYRRYVRVTKLFRRFPDALRLVENLNEEAAVDESAAGRGGLGITHLDNALLFNSEEQDVLLYIEAAAAHTKGKKPVLAFNARAFYSYAAALLNELKEVYKGTPNKDDWTFQDFLLAQVPQTKTSSLSVKAMFLNTLSLFAYDPSDKKGRLAARAKARSERLVRMVSTQFLPQSAVKAPTRERSPPPLTPSDSRPLQKRASKKPSRLQLGLPPSSPPYKTRRTNIRGEGHKVVTAVIDRRSGGSASRRPSGGWKRPPRTSTASPTVTRTVSRRREPRHGRFADSVPDAMPVGYESREYPPEFVVQLSFKLNSRLPPALRDNELESRHSSLVPFLRAAFIPRKHRANIFFSVEEVKFIREMLWVRGAYEYAKEHSTEGQNDSIFWRTAASLYREGLGAAFFAARAAEVLHRGYTILSGFGTFASAPADILQFLDYPSTLPDKFFGDFLEFMHSSFEGEEFLKVEANRKLWSPIINAGDEEHDKSERDAGRARYTSMRALVMEHLESDGERVWAARTRAAMDVWLGWIAAVLNLDDKGKYPCSLPNTGGRLLLTGRGAEAQTGHNDFAFRAGESPGFFFIVTGEEGTHLYVTPGSHLYMHYNLARKELLKEGFRMEEIEVPPSSVFIGHGYIQHAGAEWRGSHCIRYHTYLIPENHDLPDAICFGYGDSIAIGSRADAMLMEGEGSPQEAGAEIEESGNEDSGMDVDDDAGSLELSDYVLETASIPEED